MNDRWTTKWPDKSAQSFEGWWLWEEHFSNVYGQRHMSFWREQPGFMTLSGPTAWSNNCRLMSFIGQGVGRDKRIGTDVTYGKLKWEMAITAFTMSGTGVTPDFVDQAAGGDYAGLSRMSYRLVIFRVPNMSYRTVQEGSGVFYGPQAWELFDLTAMETSASAPSTMLHYNSQYYGSFDILHDEVYTCTNSESQKQIKGCLDLTGMKARMGSGGVYTPVGSNMNSIWYIVVATCHNSYGEQDWYGLMPQTFMKWELEFFDK